MTKQISHPVQFAKLFCKRLTAAVLILLLIAMFIPSAIALGNDSPILPDSDIPETLTRAQLEAHGAVARLRAEEPDEFTFVYLNEDGTRTSYSYGVAVKYEENGEYVDKDNTIKDFNNEYGNTASDVELRFPKHLNKISIKYKNHNIKIKPVTDIPAGHINASVSGNNVTYYGAFGLGMDLRYSSTMSGMKEDIILQSYQGVNTFSFEVKTGGLELKQLNGQYVIADDEEVIFSFGDLEVTDSFTGENEATDNWDEHITLAQGSIQTVKENKKYIFTITVPEEFLTADTTVYPVYVDPSFNVTSNYIQDTYISEGHPDTNYGTSTSMRLGYNPAHQRNRILVKISNLTNGQTQSGLTYSKVNSANYYMYCTSTYTSFAQVDAYMIPLTAAVWTESGATWNNASDSTSYNATLNGVATVGSAGWYNFNVKNAYTSWLAVTTNKGLMFRMNNESTEQSNIRNFASVNNADSTKLPYLTVNYEAGSQYILASPPTCILKEGGTYTAQVMTNIAPEDIVWTSNDIAVASVSTQGVINAHSPGVATITASSRYNSSICSSITVTVIRIELNYNVVYVAKGKTLATQATITPDSATITGITYSSDDTTVATVDDSGVITAVSAGTAMISARTTPGDAVASIAVIVPDFEDGEYYLKNKATGKYADVEGPTNNSGAIIHQWDFHGFASQQWEFTLLLDGYYKIKSMHSNLYLSVQNNSSEQDAPIIQSAYTGAIGQQWKLQLLDNGHYTLTPKCGESVDRVLASATYLTNNNGIDVQQRLYIDDTNYKDEWFINYAGFTIVNYYDESAENTTIIELIDEANEFASKVYKDLFGINIKMVNEPIKYTNALADQCQHQGSPCTNLECGSLCIAMHHKNTYRIHLQLSGEARHENHILVLWANRPYNTYCYDEKFLNGLHELHDAIALVYNHAPIIQFLTLDNNDTYEQRRGKMATTLVHELAHVFGMPDVYLDVGTHMPDGVLCVMDKYNSEGMNNNYNDILEGTDAFCSSCQDSLRELLANKIISGQGDVE